MREHAETWLAEVLGSEAQFRDGQWEAIEALVAGRQRVLVVQRTGWGKSLVYFLATRLLREQGAGLTVLISPLLSLMRNQIQSAAQWGVSAETLNSDNPDTHPQIEARLLAGEIDLLLISPERLANDRFQRDVWSKLAKQVGMLVIDEAHCISDWGHDFRPNYRRIMRLLNEIPANTPILGTTATANDRVVVDVAEILGAQMNIQRGPLTRDSLLLYVYQEPMSAALRLTLLSHLMSHIPGSGIIYCTTTRDCRSVADWLQAEGHNVKPYYADVEETGSESRADLEAQLLDNRVKALVSSVALGMGFDKSDLHFVIHYQLPGNIISYYQQIGRAGRGIDRAHIVLMHGPGDEDIQEHFIETAFPTPQQVGEVIQALTQNGAQSRTDLQRRVNVRQSALEKILTHLEVEHIIEKQDSDYRLLRRGAAPDYARWATVTQTRYAELAQMKTYIQTDVCLMRFIADALDDPSPIERCGRCKNCSGKQSKFVPDAALIARAENFLRSGNPMLLEPRKRYPAGLPEMKKTTIAYVNEVGVALCNYYEEGWGRQVRQGRDQAHYSDELVMAAAAMLRRYWKTSDTIPQVVMPVPSLRRPDLVPDFARRLAECLDLPYQPAITHTLQHPAQAEMRNSYQQASNVLGKFAIATKLKGSSVLLVDDIADSKWTLTIVGELLQRNGSGPVLPFVLAATNTGD
ncbi:MAG: RecQ family ATP-dependent DNA helicase [Aggregatilineales bacterium]